MKPVLLLDIDGVINAISKSFPTHVWGTLLWQTAEYTSVYDSETYPLMWARPVIEYLGSLHQQGRVEVRWHTTWQTDALTFSDIVGLPDGFATVADAPEFHEIPGRVKSRLILEGKPAWWKYPAAERVLVQEKRPLIWIDDDMSEMVRLHHRTRMEALGDVLLVSPPQSTGLTRKHFRKIEEFLLKVEEPGGALSGS